MVFQLIGYLKLVLRFCVASNINMKDKNEKIGPAQKRLLKMMKHNEKLEMSWWRT